jgi:hypothetical protein
MNDPGLISQLTTRKMFYDLKGRLRLESKDDLRSRGIKSPDRADAVAGAFAHGNQLYAEYARRAANPWNALDDWWDRYEAEQINETDSLAEKVQKRTGAWTGG